MIIILHLLNNHNIIAKEIQSRTNQNEIKKSNREKGKRTVNDLNNIEFEPLLLVIAPRCSWVLVSLRFQFDDLQTP